MITSAYEISIKLCLIKMGVIFLNPWFSEYPKLDIMVREFLSPRNSGKVSVRTCQPCFRQAETSIYIKRRCIRIKTGTQNIFKGLPIDHMVYKEAVNSSYLPFSCRLGRWRQMWSLAKWLNKWEWFNQDLQLSVI